MICEICGSDNRVTRFKRTTPLCGKHYHQMRKYGKIFKRNRYDPNEIIEYDDYAEIILYNRKGNERARTKVDPEDVERLSKMRWYVIKRANNLYVATDYRQPAEGMHRIIMDAPDGMVVDHIFGDPLDNRKKNLRVCTQQENIYNSATAIDNKTGQTGIYWRDGQKKWYAYITKSGKQYGLGYYEKKADAIQARLAGERKFFGEFAPHRRKMNEEINK